MTTEDVADTQKQNRRIMDRLSYVSLYIGACVLICVVTVVVIATLAIWRPESGSTVSTIVGLTVPIMMGLLAAGLRDVHRGIDGRVSQLVLSSKENAEYSARADTIRQMHLKLQELTPGTPEHQTLLDQIAVEAMKGFNVYERRATP